MVDVPRSVKLQRRGMSLDGRAFTVLSPRPSETFRVATNYFHETWHLLSDPVSARFVAWLTWHVGHERRSNTIAVIDQRFLVPNPFDGDSSDPIVIMNSNLGTPSRAGLSQLSKRLPLGKSEGAVRLNVRGISREGEKGWRPAHQDRHRIDFVNGLIVIAAPGPKLLDIASTGLSFSSGGLAENGSSYAFMDWPDKTGEFQVYLDFSERVRAASARRAAVFPDDRRPKLTPSEREQVWAADEC